MIIVKILICLAVPTRTAIVIVEIFTSVLISFSTIIMSWEEFFFKSSMNRNFNKPMGILLIESFVEW